MNNKTKFILSAALLCVSPLTVAVSDCPADECIIITPDDNDSMGDTGSGGGGGGSLTLGGGTGGGSDDSSGGGNSGGGSGDSSNSEEPKTQEQCIAAVNTVHSRCRATASAIYQRAFQNDCIGLGTIKLEILGLSVSIDEYDQCVRNATNIRDNAYQVCEVFKNQQVEACMRN